MFCIEGDYSSFYFSDWFSQNEIFAQRDIYSYVDQVVQRLAESLFLIASYLTYPISKSHESFAMARIIKHINPEQSSYARRVDEIAFCVQGVFMAFMAVVTGLFGLAARYAACSIQKNGFNYIETRAKILPPNNTYTILSWNVCCIGGGFSITDRGVLPWEYRIDQIIEEIAELDADIVCLSETFDGKHRLKQALGHLGYNVCYNIEPNATGPSSGLLVASKYKIKDIEVYRFPLETTHGRAAHQAKADVVCSFISDEQIIGTLCFTHAQDSELREYPSGGELEARKGQMAIIKAHAAARAEGAKHPVILTGDLNLDDNEYVSIGLRECFDKGLIEGGETTWGGDGFCARMEQKQASNPLNLDHTVIYKETSPYVESFTTRVLSTGFYGEEFRLAASSDHLKLLTTVKLRQPSTTAPSEDLVNERNSYDWLQDPPSINLNKRSRKSNRRSSIFEYYSFLF